MRKKTIYFKGLFDLIFSLAALVFLSPLMLAISLFIVLDSGFPVFFIQERAGKNGRQFLIYKFRTMFQEAVPDNNFLVAGSGDRRITRAGRLLRRFSLDEIPQFFNVLKGDMSVVGPRPTLPYQVERYDFHQRRRLSVKPGITGWAQVNGRNRLSWREKIVLDLWYVDHCSFFLDIKILFKTMALIFCDRGIYANYLDDDISAMEKVLIVGAGGHGRVVADILALSRNREAVFGFIDDNAALWGEKIAGVPVLGGVSRLKLICRQYTGLSVIVAVGNNSARQKIVTELKGYGMKYTNGIHPRAVIAGDVKMGVGVMVMAGAVINSGATIGDHSIVNTGATIDHDCILGDFSHISPGANLAGEVKVDERAHVGLGAAVLPGRRVGHGSMVGAGSVVAQDIPPGAVAKGVPARVAPEGDH